MESERLRNSLLSAISHDLRTPLAALVGLAETLALSQPRAQPGQQPSMADGDPRGGAAHERAGQQPARHGAPAEPARCGCSRTGSRWKRSSAAPLKRARAALAGRAASTSQLPADLPLVHMRRRADRAGAGQPAGERRQVHAAGSPDRDRARARPSGSCSVERRATTGPGLPPGQEERDLREVRARRAGVGHARASAWGWRSAAPSSRRTAARIRAENRAPHGGARSRSRCRSGDAAGRRLAETRA